MSVDYAKLKTNLNLIMHRLKLVEKKKMELNQKARKTIGEFLNAGKVDRARIRVEQIIREDYVVEAMDLVESYCDFLLSRFGQLQNTKVVDEGLATAVSSLIWVTPCIETDIPELKTISDQLGKKYGKEYVIAVRENQLKTVNETLMKKMNMQVPPKVLVEKYLIEIAKDQKIDYKPDPKVLKEQEIFNATGYRATTSSDDEDDSSGGVRSSAPPQTGFLIDLGDHYPMNPTTSTFSPYGEPPPLPSEPPHGISSLNTSAAIDTTDASAPSASNATNLTPIGFNLNNLDVTASSSSTNSRNSEKANSKAAAAARSKGSEEQGSQQAGPSGVEAPPPNYDSVVSKPSNNTQYYSFGPESGYGHRSSNNDDLNDTLPELPPVPKDSAHARSTSGGQSQGQTDDQIDLDDLSRRFEELKNKK